MNQSFDLLFVDIIHGYLDTAASRTAGIPAATDCALQKMDAEVEENDPRICITATESGENRSRQISVIAICRSTKARSITDPWMAQVRNRLADLDAFFAYYAALPIAKRTGYQIEKVSPPHAGRLQRDPMGPIETGVGLIFYLTI
jgi:pyrrolidone-carboxylate peptidase